MGRGRWVRLDPIMPATTDEPGLRAMRDRVSAEFVAGGPPLALAGRVLAHIDKLLASTPAASDGSLDVAWREAEEAVAAQGDVFRLWVKAAAHGYEAGYMLPEFKGGAFVRTPHDTPAAALRELAARLSESTSEGKTE